MSYLRYMCLFGSSLPPVVCRRAYVLFTLYVFVWFVFTSSCLQEGLCLIYVICVCVVRLYLQLFVGGLMSYLRYMCLFGLSLPLVVCRRAHVLFTLFVFASAQWCPNHIVLCFCFVFHRLIASFSGFSICDCPSGILQRLFNLLSYFN